MGCSTSVYRSYSSSSQCQSIFQSTGKEWFLCQCSIPWLYRCSRNLRCKRWNCRADDKPLTVITAVTSGNTLGKVRNGGESRIYPRKMTCLQGFIWLCTSHLAWHRMQEGQTESWNHIMILCYLVFLSNCSQAHRQFGRTMFFLRTSVSHWRLSKQRCNVDTGSYRGVSMFLSKGCWRCSF